ncbi:protein COBRA [Trifolium repens]|nr:protein COBRA [Trifolium repens]
MKQKVSSLSSFMAVKASSTSLSQNCTCFSKGELWSFSSIWHIQCHPEQMLFSSFGPFLLYKILPTVLPLAKIVQPTRFVKPGTSRVVQVHVTWDVTCTCTYSQFLAKRSPTCSTCACGCQSNSSQSGSCIDPNALHFDLVVAYSPLVQCTSHMCPIRVHWHIEAN